MNFLIDYDTRSVECRSEVRDLLEKYVAENDLNIAVTIISNEDDMLLEMSIGEIQELYENITMDDRKFDNEEDAASHCWSALNSHNDDFPVYTKALGKKLLKAGDKRSSDSGRQPQTKAPSGKPAPAKKPSGSITRKRKKSYIGSTFTVGENPPMKGRHTRIVEFIDDNMGEATGEELEAFLEGEGTKPAEHISYAIRNGFIVEAEDV